MNLSTRTMSIFTSFFAVLVFLMLPAQVRGQQKKSAPSAPAKSAPAAKAPATHAPASTGHPSTTTGGHTTTTTAGHTTTTTAGRTTTTGAAGKTTTGTAGKTTTTGTAGKTTTTGTAGKTTTTGTAGKTTTAGTAAKTNTTAASKTNTGAAAGKGTSTAAAGKSTGTAAKTPGTTNGPNGSKTVTRANGSSTSFNKSGKTTSMTTASGKTANFSSSGKVTSIHSGGMTINKGPGGSRRVETVNKNGSRVVSTGRHGGYVEHGYSRGGHDYNRRTYYRNGHAYARVYGRGYYHGYYYNHYVPGYYYGAGFYGWAYNPWAAPVVYGWGWGAAPWYGYYGYYYQPYPVYPYPALWLTDYLIAANLQLAYAAQAEAGADSGQVRDAQLLAAAYHPGEDGSEADSKTSPALTPELKQSLADEVKVMIAAEKDAAAANQQSNIPANDQPPGALDPKFHVFVVSATLTEKLPDGTECSLSQGDFLTRVDDTPDADKNVKVTVSSSQKDDCPAGSQLSVALDDLQDMYNSFHEQIDDGLKSMAENQGKNGLPTGPAAGGHTVAEGQAQPDLTAKADLDQQNAEADKAESEVSQAAKTSNSD
jgi:hypothetical protein